MRFSERMTRPCDQRWDDLVPRGEGRYCDHCDTVVIDLSRLTRREALERTKNGACVRARLDERGEPMFRPDPVRRPGLRVLAVAAALTGCSAAEATDEVPPVSAPIDAAIVPVEVELPTGVAVDELPPEALPAPAPTEVVPTPEQLELTRRKRERRARVSQPSPPPSHVPHYHFLGGITPDF
jgi:hypothetical protein